MLFDEQVALKPNNYPWTEEFIDSLWAGFWTPNEFDFKSDYNQFKVLMNDSERQMLVRALSAIGQVEIAVKKFWSLLGDRLPQPCMSDLGFVMANTEVIHGKAYVKLLDCLGLEGVFEENLKAPALAGRVKYLRKYLKRTYPEDQRKQFIYSLILFTLFVENVSLFSQFYVVLNLNTFKNILKDTAQQIQYTKNEETLHGQIGIKLINTLRDEYPHLFDDELEARIEEEVLSAIEAEDAMVDWIVGDYSGERLDAHVLKQFVRRRINDSLHQAGFDVRVPVDPEAVEQTRWFDEVLLGYEMNDFFHNTSTNYSRKNKVFDDEELF